MKLKFLILTLGLCIGALTINTSCQKKTDCQARIHTVDSAGNALSGVSIKLYANVKTQSGSTVEADLKATGVSDGSGVTSFTFKLPAILDISAVYGTKTGQSIIKLEEGKTTDQTVTVK